MSVDTTIDRWTVRRAMWQGMVWAGPGAGYVLNPEKMAAGLSELVRGDVLARLFAKVDVDTYLAACDRVDDVVQRRCEDIVQRVVTAVEEQGLAVPGVEGSIDRVLDSLLHSVNGDQS